MSANLDTILAATRRRVAQAKKQANLKDLEQHAQAHNPRGFRASLKAVSQHDFAIIAELKKASPSRGLIRAEFDPRSLAVCLADAGATALSVLTVEDFFRGSLQNLEIASSSSSLPCLRKDFIVDEFQLLQARAHRADAVLLIVAALSDAELRMLYGQACAWKLDVLCEVHDEAELARALGAGCETIGVNSRDLRTFNVNMETPMRLAGLMPASVLTIAESGIHNGEDLRRLRNAGYDGFLIGESLMKAQDPGAALRALLIEARTENLSKPPVS
jgi:indole-3-glycerol phosphate synthase